MLVVADAFHQAPHEVNEWPLEWLYKASSLISYKNEEQEKTNNTNQPESSAKTFKGQSLADWGE